MLADVAASPGGPVVIGGGQLVIGGGPPVSGGGPPAIGGGPPVIGGGPPVIGGGPPVIGGGPPVIGGGPPEPGPADPNNGGGPPRLPGGPPQLELPKFGGALKPPGLGFLGGGPLPKSGILPLPKRGGGGPPEPYPLPRNRMWSLRTPIPPGGGPDHRGDLLELSKICAVLIKYEYLCNYIKNLLHYNLIYTLIFL